MATPYDAAWKLLLSFPVLLHDLLAGFVPRAWVAHLDLSQSQDRSGSLVSNGLLQRHQDVVREVPFRDGTGSVLVALECQSTVDPTMPAPECLCRGAVRMLVYTALHYQGRLRKRKSPGKQDSPDKQGSRDQQDPSSEQDPLPKLDLSILDDLNEGKTMPNEVMRERVARWAEQRLAERALHGWSAAGWKVRPKAEPKSCDGR